MSDRRCRPSYEQMFVAFSEKVERWLIRSIVGAAILLVLVQALLQFSAVRQALTMVDEEEGTPYLLDPKP